MRAPLGLALGLVLSGCNLPAASQRLLPRSSHFDGDMLTEQHPKRTGPEAVYSVEWRRELLEPEFLEFKPREFAAPAVDDSERVYVATRDGFIRCLDHDGRTLWEYKSKGPFYGGIELDNETLYLSSADGVLMALHAPDGTLKWKYRAGEELGSRPVVANGLVYVSSFNDTVFAVDAETGAWKWQYRRESTSEFTIRGVGTPVVDFDKIFVGFSDGTAACLDSGDGTLKWKRQLSSTTQFPDVDADPQLDGQGHVLFASYASGVFSLDEETGTIIWGKSMKGVTSLLLDNDQVYVGSAGQLSAREAANGEERWRAPLGDAWAGPPTLAGRYLIVPTTEALVFLDRKNGRTHRRFNPGRGVSAAPAYRGGKLFVISNWGYLYALFLNAPAKGPL
jgi:outer membrane protein assembly factor BamB